MKGQEWMTVGEGTEPEVREDEKVCEVTGLTYYAGLPASPHTEQAQIRALTPMGIAQLAHAAATV